MEAQDNSVVQEYKEPINYPLAVIGAIGGAAIGIAIWAASVYFTKGDDGSYSFYYITPIVVGALAGSGATMLGRGNNIKTALIALVIGTIGVLVGDAMESAAIVGSFNLDINDYIAFAQDKFDEFPIRYILYLVAIGAAFFTGFTDSRRNQS